MAEFEDIVDKKNRVNYKDLCSLVGECLLSRFTSQVLFPLLVGKELYDGELSQDDHFDGTMTMKFNVAGLREQSPEPGSSSISRAIYTIRKNTNASQKKSDIITIGRSQHNDIVIPDFVISKSHAQIITQHSRYYIADSNSTNGTTIDGEDVPPGNWQELKFGSLVGFGRYCFIFSKPEDLYRAIRHEKLGL